jgi:electron transport complex protein RnfG
VNASRLEALRSALPYQPLLLATVAVAAGLALTLADRATRAPIARAEAEDKRQILAQVVPPALADNDLLADRVSVAGGPGGRPLVVHRAVRQGRVQAAAFEVVGRGYAGDIVLLIGVDRDGRVLGVRVLRHRETPGLGDKIEIGRHPWIDSFRGRTLERGGWAVRKDGGEFDAFAGATITPRAVVRAVHEGLQWFAAQRAVILGETR